MSWEKYDDSGERWSWTADEERHLLVRVGDWLHEYHEVPGGAVTVHEYAVGEEEVPVTAPLTNALHARTVEVPANHAPWVRALDDREVCDWLAAAGYAK